MSKGVDNPRLESTSSPALDGGRVFEGVGSSLDEDFPLVPRYSGYASMYDDLGQERFALSVLPLISLIVRRYCPSAHQVLDLACGTGAASIALSREGYAVVGVDRSSEMLDIARRKASDAGLQIEFIQQDMTALGLNQAADLVISLYDSVNYLLTGNELEAAFRGVARALNPGGLFIFDVNTVHCLETEWGNRIRRRATARPR